MRKALAALAFILFGLISTFATATPPPHLPGSIPYFLSEPFSIGGDFSGMGVQDTGSPWQVRLSDGAFEIMLEYPDLKCGGSPEIIRSTGSWILFRERLSFDEGQCVDGGFVLIRDRSDRAVDYVWCGEGGSNAAAVLVRDGLRLKGMDELVQLTLKSFPDAGNKDAYTHLCLAARKGNL